MIRCLVYKKKRLAYRWNKASTDDRPCTVCPGFIRTVRVPAQGGVDWLCNNGRVGHTRLCRLGYNGSAVSNSSQPTIVRELSINDDRQNQLSPRNQMVTLKVSSLKVALPFKAGQLPVAIDPDNPSFVIDLDGLRVLCKINAKAARKLRVHNETGGGTVLSGKLQVVNGELTLVEGGFQFLSKPDDTAAGGSTA